MNGFNVDILTDQLRALAARLDRLEMAVVRQPSKDEDEDEYLTMKELCVRFHRSRWVLGPQVQAAVAEGRVRVHKATPRSRPTYRVHDVELLGILDWDAENACELAGEEAPHE